MLRRHHQLTARHTAALHSLRQAGSAECQSGSPAKSGSTANAVGMAEDAVGMAGDAVGKSGDAASMDGDTDGMAGDAVGIDRGQLQPASTTEPSSSTRTAVEHAVAGVSATTTGLSSSSDQSNGSGTADRTYRQCKQVGSKYSRQWHQLQGQGQGTFSGWMHKPEQLEGFTV